jgi:hypothetical protein
MRRHEDTRVSFEIPEGWVPCGTLLAREPGACASISAEREPLRGNTLRAHADWRLAECARRLTGFDLLESREATLGGRPAVYMRFAWLANFGPVEEMLTMTLLERVDEADTAIMTVSTCTRRGAARPMQATLTQVLASVVLHDKTAPRGSAVGT